MLTTAQLATLKAAILADPVLAAQPSDGNGLGFIAEAMNASAVPAFTVWKTSVFIEDVGDNIVGNDLAGLSTLNNTRLQTAVMMAAGGLNPSLVDRRFFFDDIFSGAGGAATRAKLLILWKRLALRIEKILAVGTGTDAAPATLTFEGTITANDVDTARRS